MSRYHVLAGLPESAEELRSLGLFEALSPRLALDRCLHDVDGHRLLDADPLSPDVADALERERRHLRERLRDPDMCFIVTPVEAEAHFLRDHDAADVTRRRARIRRAFGVDAL